MSSNDTTQSTDLLTYEQAADALHITRAGLRNAVMQGRIQPVKIAGVRQKFVRRADLEAYKASRYQSMRKRPERSPTAVAAPIAVDELLAKVADTLAPHYERIAESAGRGAGESAGREFTNAISTIVSQIVSGGTNSPKVKAS